MSLKRDSHPELYPHLVPLIGGTDKKPRFLDKEVVAVGRARGCDVLLDANEVSAIHCMFYRGVTGYRIRDCGSRTGTRLNGAAIKNSNMADGDVLQIGPFSFEVKLPALPALSPTLAPELYDRVQRSRRNLVRMALQLRRKLRQVPREHGQAEKAADLKAKIRGYDQRFSQLEQSERELVDERNQLAAEIEAHRRHVQKVETGLAERLQQTEHEIHERWVEFQKRCAAEEARLHGLSGAEVAKASADAAALEELQRALTAREQQLRQREAAWERQQREAEQASDVEMAKARAASDADLDRRQAALDAQAATLRQSEAALRQQKSELNRMLSELKGLQEELRKQPRGDSRALQQENQQLRQTVEELEKRSADGVPSAQVQELLAAQEQIHATLVEEARALRERLAAAEQGGGAELAEVRAENDELRQILQRQLLKSTAAGGEELRAENQRLRQELAEYEQRLAEFADAPDAATGQLRDENELLRQLLLEKDKVLDEIRTLGSPAGELPLGVREQLQSQELELERMRGEIARLEQQVEAERRQQPPAVGSPSLDDMDLDSLEAELSRERRQIEAERAKLNKEIEALRSRNAELDEATREMEMELSRERADMARERIRLDRMREEIKTDMERLQRDGSVRESLTSFQRLREEMKTASNRR